LGVPYATVLMHKRQGTSPSISELPFDLSEQALSKRLPSGTLRRTSFPLEEGEAWGLLFYAASAFCSSLMIITVKIALKSGLSTWELLMARSVFLAAVCVVQIKRANEDLLGERCDSSFTVSLGNMFSTTIPSQPF
jgi:hypothetical protein